MLYINYISFFIFSIILILNFFYIWEIKPCPISPIAAEHSNSKLLSFLGKISKYCTGKMVYINVAVCLAVLLFVIGLSVGLSVNTFKGRDALDSVPLIDG